MNTRFLKVSGILAVFSILVAAAVFSTATYAWFTANRIVSASRIEAITDTMELTLYVKAPSDSTYTGNVCELRFTGGNALSLTPVSTADLQHFLYCPTTVSGNAARFVPVGDITNQDQFCYGVIDMRAELTGTFSAASVAVYLDESAELGALVEQAGEDSLLLNAARLGIMVGGAPDTAKIFYLSQEQNPEDQQIRNTIVNGQLLEGDMVLKSDAAGNISPVADPAIPLSACMLSDETDPGEPLFYLQPGVDYQIQVFFYLEGCDPDCSDSIAFHAADLALAFYATLVSEG